MIAICLLLVAWSAFFMRSLVAETLFDFIALDQLQQPQSLSQYRNASVILVVNVASNCGYTYINYRELDDLYDKYHSRGLEILGLAN